MDNNNKFSNTSIIKLIVVLSSSIVLANILQITYQFIDSYWVGKLGTGAIATTTVSSTFIFLMVSFGIGLSTAGSILVSQYYGKKDTKMVNYIASQTILMVSTVAIVIGISGYLLTPFILSLMGIDKDILEQTTIYLKISFISLVFNFIFFMIQALLIGIGQTKIPILITLFTVILNFIFDPLLIFGYGNFTGFGVVGAEIATIITQSIACGIGLFILIKGSYGIKITLSDFIPDKEIIKKSFFLGFPSSIEMFAKSASSTVLILIVTSFGTLALASYGLASNILQVAVILSMGISSATSILVGQSIGANLIDNAKKISNISAIISFIFMSFIGIILFIFTPYIINFFTPNNIEIIEMGTKIIRISSLFLGLTGVFMSYSGVLKSIGKTQIPMYLTIFGQIIFKLFIAYFLSKYTFLKLNGIWWSEPITVIILVIIIFIITMKTDRSKSNLTIKS